MQSLFNRLSFFFKAHTNAVLKNGHKYSRFNTCLRKNGPSWNLVVDWKMNGKWKTVMEKDNQTMWSRTWFSQLRVVSMTNDTKRVLKGEIVQRRAVHIAMGMVSGFRKDKIKWFLMLINDIGKEARQEKVESGTVKWILISVYVITVWSEPGRL